MYYYSSVIPILQRYVKLTQTAEPVIHRLHNDIIVLACHFLAKTNVEVATRFLPKSYIHRQEDRLTSPIVGQKKIRCAQEVYGLYATRLRSLAFLVRKISYPHLNKLFSLIVYHLLQIAMEKKYTKRLFTLCNRSVVHLSRHLRDVHDFSHQAAIDERKEMTLGRRVGKPKNHCLFHKEARILILCGIALLINDDVIDSTR